MSVSGIKAGNPEQAELIRLIMENKTKIVFCIGDAGTGKNYCSIAAALQLQSDKKYKDIYYGRNPVQCGQEVGFTTGSLEEKLAIYMHPLYDTLENIAHKGGAFRAENARARVQMFEITTARGRSIDNAVVIIDECQNLDAKTLQTIITRMGTYSKLILIGSYNQIDLKSQWKYEKCDFQLIAEGMRDAFPDFVGYVELIESMRSPWCAMTDKFLTQLRKDNNR